MKRYGANNYHFQLGKILEGLTLITLKAPYEEIQQALVELIWAQLPIAELDQVVFFYWILCINGDFKLARKVFEIFLKGKESSLLEAYGSTKPKIIQLLYHGLSLEAELGTPNDSQ